MHCIKLPLCKWLKGIYFIINSSKDISSVVFSRWLGITKITAWKMAHAIRTIMEPRFDAAYLLNGIVELDEKYIGCKHRY